MAAQITVERRIAHEGVRSLAWMGGDFVDWVSGGRRFTSEGRVVERAIYYPYNFDTAVVSPSGRYTAIISQIGTAALLLCDGQVVKQLNRDWYHADAYPYPLAFAQLADGREFLIHCPEKYCGIEIEDLATGRRLGAKQVRNNPDIFHSRLSCSPSGKRLISAGWVWHPLGVAQVFDLDAALVDSATLDYAQYKPPGCWEIASAVFIDDDTVLVGTSDEFFGDDDSVVDNQPGKNRIAVWKIGSLCYERSVEAGFPPGILMPVGDRFAVSFYEHPRLISLDTGRVISEWPHIGSGKQSGSITWSDLPPPIAIDRNRSRFAVSDAKQIYVVEFDLAALAHEHLQ